MFGLLTLAALLCASQVVAESADAGRSRSLGSGAGLDDAAIERLRQLHYTESHEVRMVLLPTAVTDRKGRAVPGLRKEDFRLFEDQQLQEIRYFTSDAREPISIAFVLDVSGSMRQLDKLAHAKEAIRFFVDRLEPRDRFALICFADRQVAWVTEFTGDRRRFLRRLAVQEGYGQTALNDAVAATPGLVDANGDGRKAIVLITDGVDNYSKLDVQQAVGVAQRVGVPIYTVGFMSVQQELMPKGAVETNLEVLRYVSDETGGRLFAVHDPDELKEAVTLVDAELRHQYLIGYYPTWTRADGRFRQIRLESSKRRLEVRTRAGYFANP